VTKIDENGNTVSTSYDYLRKLVRDKGRNMGDTFTTDSHGRIMVDVTKGGYIVFFEQDEPQLAETVRRQYRNAD